MEIYRIITILAFPALAIVLVVMWKITKPFTFSQANVWRVNETTFKGYRAEEFAKNYAKALRRHNINVKVKILGQEKINVEDIWDINGDAIEKACMCLKPKTDPNYSICLKCEGQLRDSKREFQYKTTALLFILMFIFTLIAIFV